jgi:hypothetical protein
MTELTVSKNLLKIILARGMTALLHSDAGKVRAFTIVYSGCDIGFGAAE